jgi:hypothetical protein
LLLSFIIVFIINSRGGKGRWMTDRVSEGGRWDGLEEEMGREETGLTREDRVEERGEATC